MFVAASSPQAAEDDVVAGLYNEGINVFAQSNATQEIYNVITSYSIHYTKLYELKAAGAQVFVAASSPQAAEDDVVAGLYNEGINVFAQSNATQEIYKKQLMKAVECNPNVIIDTNGDLMTLLHNECRVNSKEIIGGCEETTTGIRRAQARAKAGKLDYPVIASIV